jgi:predicted ATPase/DNA-binding CsgD family transcriptional regulator
VTEQRKNPVEPLVEPLTRREREILGLLADGLSAAEIAERLTLAVSSVKWYVQQVYGKLGVNNKKRALARAAELGLLPAQVGAGLAPAQIQTPASATAPAAEPAPRHNLPLEVTRFFGREAEIEQLQSSLLRNRLVTLVGSGGVGKSRLSLRAAHGFVDAYHDGVWLVELAPVTNAALVPQQVAATLGVRDEPEQPILDTLLHFLRGRHLLLILDNCEHLLGACARLADRVLRSCPRVTLLASSREPLGVAGESVFSVPSLAFPDEAEAPALEHLTAFPALRLFVDRAQLVEPDYAVTDGNAAAVVRICQRLDGIPLALELAAARLRLLDTQTLAARLEDVFAVLTGNSRTALPRQQTLRATLDWSYRLLNDEERLLLARLSVFAGGATLEAIEAVCGDASLGGGLAAGQLLDGLGALVDKSMVRSERKSGREARYFLLETVRQYAREKLNESGDSQRLHASHLHFFTPLAEEAEPKLRGPEQIGWLNRLDSELANLRAALEYAQANGLTDWALRLAGAIWRFWFLRGHLVEGETWLQRVLELPGGPPHLRTSALTGAAFIASFLGNTYQSEAWAAESLALARSSGDYRLAAISLGLSGDFHVAASNWTAAAQLLAEGVAAARQSGDAWALAFTLAEFAQLPEQPAQAAERAAVGAESVALARTIGDRWLLAFALFRLGRLATYRKDFATALRLHEEGLALQRELGDRLGMAYALLGLGDTAFAQGEVAKGLAHFEERLALELGVGNQQGAAAALRDMAFEIWFTGDATRALTLLQKYLRAGETISTSFGVWAALAGQCGISLAIGDYPAARESALAIPKVSSLPREKGSVRVRLGQVDYFEGRLADAQAHFEAALSVFRELNDQNGMCWTPPWLGAVAYRAGDLDRAQGLIEEGLALEETGGYWPEVVFAHFVYGDVARAQGQASLAAEWYARSLKTVVHYRDQPDVAERLEGFAKLAGEAHQPQRAARLFGAAEALRERIGLPIPPVERADYDRAVALARAQLDPAAFNSAWAAGKALNWEQAAAYALEVQPSRDGEGTHEPA